MRLSGYLYREILTIAGLLLAAVLGLGWWGVVRALDAQAWARADEAADRVVLALEREVLATTRMGATLRGWWLGRTIHLDQPEGMDALALPMLEEQTAVSSVNLCAADGTSILLLRQDGSWQSRALRRLGPSDAKLRWTHRREDGTHVEAWEPTGYDPRQRDWYVRATEAKEPTWSPEAYRFMTTQDPGLTLSVPVRRAGVLEGVIGLDLILDDLTASVWEVQPTPGTRIAIADAKGRALLLPHRPQFLLRATRLGQFLEPVGGIGTELAPLAEDLASVPSEGRRVVTHGDGMSFYGLVHPYRGPAGLTWYVMVAIPEPEIMGVSRSRALGVLVLAILGFGLLMVRARSVAHRFGQPLDHLAGAPTEDPGAAAGAPGATATLALGEALQRAGRAAQEHSTLREQLHHSQRRETVATLASGVAHDVNNQLTIVLGQLEPTLDALGPDHPISQDLALARQAARRCAEMNHALLAYSRGAPRQATSRLDLNRVVQQVAVLVTRVLGPSVSLSVELEPHLPAVNGREVQLEQALVNLLINARDAMAEGGAIVVRTARDEGCFVRVEVQDTGPGIPPDLLERIFEPFFSTKAPGRGTGLGLPMVQHIVVDHGGRVEVSSRQGQGTTFTLRLPAASEPIALGTSKR